MEVIRELFRSKVVKSTIGKDEVYIIGRLECTYASLPGRMLIGENIEREVHETR